MSNINDIAGRTLKIGSKLFFVSAVSEHFITVRGTRGKNHTQLVDVGRLGSIEFGPVAKRSDFGAGVFEKWERFAAISGDREATAIAQLVRAQG